MKEAIALLINDIHVSKDNISDFNQNWDEMLAICKREDIADIVIGGDMFTSRASQSFEQGCGSGFIYHNCRGKSRSCGPRIF